MGWHDIIPDDILRRENILKKVNFYEDMIWSWQIAAVIREIIFWSFLVVTDCKFSSAIDEKTSPDILKIFFHEKSMF